MNPFLLALIPSAIFGTLNWLYWRSKGYTGFETMFFSYLIFWLLGFKLVEFLLK